MHTAKLVAFSSLFAIVACLTSCAPQSFIAPPSQPSPVPGRINTTVAQTAAIAQAQTITALPTTSTPTNPPGTFTPTRTPTQTPTTTPTVLFLFPTETIDPTILFEATTRETDNGESEGETEGEENEEESYLKDREWNCIILGKSPPDGTVFSPKTKFKVRWFVKNIGTKTWPQKGVDVVFKTGGRFHDRAYYDIPITVQPGGTVTVEITLTTDYRKDKFRTYWALRVGKNDFCVLPFSFEVR